MACLSAVACTRQSPASPSAILEILRNSNGAVPWSPYLVVQADGRAIGAYEEGLRRLRAAGNLEGVRIPIDPRGAAGTVTSMIARLGIELTGVIDNGSLFSPQIEDTLDATYRMYPEIKIFQVGNEVTNFTGMSIDAYMAILRRVYDHTVANHSDITLITQSTFGSGDRGPKELEKMIDLGLTELSPDRVIVGINAYSGPAINLYTSVISRRLAGYRIWVMETGMEKPDSHLSFVVRTYPVLKGALRAERIYWFVLWGGYGRDHGFSLIHPYEPPLSRSPLYDILTGNFDAE